MFCFSADNLALQSSSVVMNDGFNVSCSCDENGSQVRDQPGTPTGAEPEEYDLWFLIIYAIIIILGLLGNLLVMILIAVIRRLRTAPNIFVFNLCFADFLLGFCALFAFVDEVDAEWALEVGACRVFGFISFMPPIAVVLSMVIVAKIRHQAITSVSISQHKVTRRRVVLYLALIWTISALLSLPILLGLVSVRAGLFCACCFYFKENIVYGLTITTAAYVIPNILILYYYIRIFIHVRKSRIRVQQHSGTGTTTHNTAKKADIQLAMQFIVLFVIFNLCYMPTMIVFWVEDEDNPLSTVVHAIVMLIFALNIILNPLVYFAFNKGARREISKCCTCCRKKSDSSDTRSREGGRETPTRVPYTADPSRQYPETSVDHNSGAITLDTCNSHHELPMDNPTKEPAETNSNSHQSYGHREDHHHHHHHHSTPVEVAATEASRYLFIACAEASLANGAVSNHEQNVNTGVNKDKKLTDKAKGSKEPIESNESHGSSSNDGQRPPPATVSVFLNPKSSYLTVPRTQRIQRGSTSGVGSGRHGQEPLRLERLSIVSIAGSSEDGDDTHVQANLTESHTHIASSDSAIIDSDNKPIISQGEKTTAATKPLKDSVTNTSGSTTTKTESSADSGFKE